MPYLASQKDIGGQALDKLSSRQTFSSKEHSDRETAKWPLWRTALGVIVLCSAFWTLVLKLVF